MVSQTLTGTGHTNAALSLDYKPTQFSITLTRHDDATRTVAVDDGPPTELLRLRQHSDPDPGYTWVIATTPTHDIELRVSNQS